MSRLLPIVFDDKALSGVFILVILPAYLQLAPLPNRECCGLPIQLKFRVTPQEREMIETKMAQFGTTNMAAYLRKMAIDGYVVKLDLPELRELVSLLRYSSNNLNQLTRRAHETGRIYEADLEDIQQSQERIWTAAEKIVSSLAALK